MSAKLHTSALVLHDCHSMGLPVVVGCPFRTGGIGPSAVAEIGFEDGSSTQAQCQILNPVDESGVQWLELSFFATTGRKATVALLQDKASIGPDCVESTPWGAILCNGRVRVTLDTRIDSAPVRIERREANDGAWNTIGQLFPEALTNQGLASAVKKDSPCGPVRTVQIIRNGPVRGQAEIVGQLMTQSGLPSLSYRLTIELWAGLDALRADWRLSHRVPAMAAFRVDRASLLGDWIVGDNTQRRFVQSAHGEFYCPRVVVNRNSVALVSDFTCAPVHVADPSMLLDTVQYPHFLAPPLISTESWLALCGSKAHVYAQLVDFSQSRPNRLESHGTSLNYHLIPEGHSTNWPQGRSREQTCLFAFAGGQDDATTRACRDMNALWHPGRAQPSVDALLGLERYDMPLVLRHGPGMNVRINCLLHLLCELETVADKWSLGDTIDTSYSLTYAAIPNRLEKLPHAQGMQPQFATAGGQYRLYPRSAVQFFEPVWTNNEYDALHALVQETFRTGKSNHLNLMRWVARHNIDVDFVAFSDHRWHHRATPAHSAHHNTTGAYPSHFWTQGLLQFYLLTGDRDALEVAIALGDKAIENYHDPELRKVQYGFNREIGWGLLTLVSLAEVTGIARFREECDKLADFLQGFDRSKFKGSLPLSFGRTGRSLERQIIGNGFGYASMIEAMDRYQRLSHREDTALWLKTFLEDLRQQTWIAIEEGEVPNLWHMITHIMAIGYERTGNRDFLNVGCVILEAGLDGILDSGAFRNITGNGEVKMSAMAYRALCRFAGHADRQGLLNQFELATLGERRNALGRRD